MSTTNETKNFSLELEKIDLIIIKLFTDYGINAKSDNEVKKLILLIHKNLKIFYDIEVSSFSKSEIENFTNYVKDYLNNRLIQPPKQIIGLRNDDDINLEEIFIKFNRSQK